MFICVVLLNRFLHYQTVYYQLSVVLKINSLHGVVGVLQEEYVKY